MLEHPDSDADGAHGLCEPMRSAMSKAIAIIGISFMVASCVHKPPALTMPHDPTVTTDQRPGALTR